MKNKIILLLLCFISFISCSQKPYIVKQEGNIPVLLSAPHGGDLKPKIIKDRQGNSFKTDADTWTIEILKLVNNELKLMWGTPYYIYSNLHRSKLDFNREFYEATDSNTTLIPIYNSYHDFLSKTSVKVIPKLLIVDIHGHTHSENMIELGYGIDYTELEELKNIKNNRYWTNKSFGFILNKLYGKAIAYPPANTKPALYFKGGYIVQRIYDNAFCIQIELPQNIRKFDREKISKILAKTIKEFYNLNFK